MTGRDPSDPDAPPTDEELRESQRLREALDDPRKPSPDADLLRAVKNAAAPSALDKKDLDAAVERGLASAEKGAGGVVIRVVFGAGAALAVAAAVVILIGRSPSASTTELAHTRSTQPLFSERFESHGGESARIDRIAVARAADLRDNHFARWGVRR